MEIETIYKLTEKEVIDAKYHKDFLIKKAVKDINRLRAGTPFEHIKETPKNLALRINKNPHLCGIGNDLEYVLATCSMKGNYSFLYMLLK